MQEKHQKSTLLLVYLLVLVVALVPARLAVAVSIVSAQGQSQDSSLPAQHCRQLAMQYTGNDAVARNLSGPDEAMDCCNTVCDCPSCAQCLHAPGSILSLLSMFGDINRASHPLMCAHAQSALRGIELSPPYIPPQV